MRDMDRKRLARRDGMSSDGTMEGMLPNDLGFRLVCSIRRIIKVGVGMIDVRMMKDRRKELDNKKCTTNSIRLILHIFLRLSIREDEKIGNHYS